MTTEVEYKKSQPEVLETVANVRYHHLTQPWDAPLSFGIQAFIEYNGLVMNDRYQADVIRVTGITGLDDAEVRDAREPRPGESGEYPYDAFYGGRNLVLNGFFETGSLPVLKTLERNLKAAFAPLNDSPLKFRWFDIYDPFDDPNTINEYNPNAYVGSGYGNYLPLIGSLSKLKVENGFLQWKEAATVAIIRAAEKRVYCDLQMTLKCLVGEKDASYIGFIPCVKNSENYIVAKYEENSGSPKLVISVVDSNTEHELVSEELISSLRPVIGQAFWLRGRKEGNKLYLEYWNESPSLALFPSQIISTTLTGEDEENYGDEVVSSVGIIGLQTNTKWSFDEFKIESLYPGDVKFDARKISPISIKDEQTSLTKFKRSFQITMKTADFRAFSSTKVVQSIYPTVISEVPSLGRSYPRSYPLRYDYFTSSNIPLENNLVSINNRGSTYTEPIFYLFGPGENILIENLTNGQALEWLGKVNEGDYLIFNCREKTIVNSLGTNYLEPLVPNVEWVRLEPMWNDIYIQGFGFVSGTTKLAVVGRHGFM